MNKRRQDREFRGPKLPHTLLQRFESEGSGAASSGGRKKSQSKKDISRKDRRREERQHKKAPRSARNGFPTRSHEQDEVESEDVSLDAPRARKPVAKIQPSKESPELPAKPLKSALKRSDVQKTARVHAPDEQPKVPHISRAVKEKIAEEDAEIAALEKKLGIRTRKKRPTTSDDNDLDALLGEVDGGSDSDEARGLKRKRADYDDFLQSKRRAISPGDSSESDGPDQDDNSDDFDDHDDDASNIPELDGSGLLEDSDTEVESKGFSDNSEATYPQQKQRENPYVAPVVSSAQTEKYVPPSLRATSDSDAVALTALRRKVQGSLNRLSEANLVTIVRDIEKLYQSNARQHVTSTTIDRLTGLLADRTRLNDTFIILHAGFIAALYRVIGVEFGAQMIERVISELDNARTEMTDLEHGSKIAANMTSLLVMLYVFQVISCHIVFDYIRILLGDLSESNAELLLIVVRHCGTQLRHDDPSALKDIVAMLQSSAAGVGEANLSVRTKFMIETVTNLKNNKVKTGAAASAVFAEHTSRMKKSLGSLKEGSTKASEPLRIGLSDVRNSEKTGKWWLVGASWKGKEVVKESRQEAPHSDDVAEVGQDSVSADLFQLAREQGMNTEVRRAIFVSIMSATDYKDAYFRLLKLALKKSQELELPRVLNQCAGAEQSYNPFYTLIACKLCVDHRMMKAFQFGLWDLFKRMGERTDEDEDGFDDDGETLTTVQLVNYGRMYGHLVASRSMPITSLKKLNFAYLKPKTRAFLEVLVSTMILDSQKRADGQRNEKPLIEILNKAGTSPEVAKGLQLFLRQLGDDAAIARNKREKDVVRWGLQAMQELLPKVQLRTEAEGEIAL